MAIKNVSQGEDIFCRLNCVFPNDIFVLTSIQLFILMAKCINIQDSKCLQFKWVLRITQTINFRIKYLDKIQVITR